jgi:hypothetical protein
MSKHEYWTNAQECERMAENSLDPSDKAAWLQLARRWLRMVPNAGGFEAPQGIGQTEHGKS